MDKRDERTIWLTCPDCEATCRDRELQPGQSLRCVACGGRIKKYGGLRSLEIVWALASAGLIFAVLANAEAILTFGILGNNQTNHIFTGITGLVSQGYAPVALLVFFGAILGPILHFAAVWYVSGACYLGRRWPLLMPAFKLAKRLEPWNLIPVYAVAIFVSVVKLDLLGEVVWKEGTLWVLLMSVCFLFIIQFFDHHMVQCKIEELT